MIIYVDVDNTICSTPTTAEYEKAQPIYGRIKKINDLYDNGNTIIYWTARGTESKLDWSSLTKKQFEEWGVKYHDLQFNKPVYDLFIDDKNINSDTFFSELGAYD
jgi:hypothetical protein